MLIRSIITTGTLLIAITAHAATLTIDLGNSDGSHVCTVGSCFGLDYQIPLNGIPDTFVNISGLQGLIVDGVTIQPASGSHLGAPDGSEAPSIDNPWDFGGTGMHFTGAPLTKSSGTGNTMSLDLTGLGIIWGGRTLGRYESALGVYEGAMVTCQFNCGGGESYLLTYRMLLSAECGPEGDPSCFGRQYQYDYLTLRGMIVGNDLANVPVPAAAWLFGSGLIGLAGVARKRQMA